MGGLRAGLPPPMVEQTIPGSPRAGKHVGVVWSPVRNDCLPGAPRTARPEGHFVNLPGSCRLRAPKRRGLIAVLVRQRRGRECWRLEPAPNPTHQARGHPEWLIDSASTLRCGRPSLWTARRIRAASRSTATKTTGNTSVACPAASALRGGAGSPKTITPLRIVRLT